MNDNRTPTIPQNENTSRVATVLANSSADEIEEMNIFDNSLYISDNEYLELKIKKEDRVNIKSGESILFKNKVYNNEKKEIEVLIKVFKNIDIKSDAKKLENRKKILELVYEKRKEVEENNLARVISYGKVITNL